MKWFEIHCFLNYAIRQVLNSTVKIISVPINLRIMLYPRDRDRNANYVERVIQTHGLSPVAIAPPDSKVLSVAIRRSASEALGGAKGATKLEYVTMLCILMVGLIPAAGIVGANSEASLTTLEAGFGGSSETTNPGGIGPPVSAASPPGLTDALDPELTQGGPHDRARELPGSAPSDVSH